MRVMNRVSRYRKGAIILEIQSPIPEKFINLLWKNEVEVKFLRRESITTFTLEVSLKDYEIIEQCAEKSSSKIRVLSRKGWGYYWVKIRRRATLALGFIFFLGLLYLLSTFIWSIDIITDGTLTPYEIRRQLMSFGVTPGIHKSKINVYTLEQKMIKGNKDILWIRIRTEGAKLKVSVLERQSPPQLVNDTEPCDLVAKRDGQIVRIYAVAGTAIVKPQEVVKKGQVLILGEEGREGTKSIVHAKGEVTANTFYEKEERIPTVGVKRQRTGKYVEKAYIYIGTNKFYLKNSINKFEKYDKIEDNSKPIKTERYYEVVETSYEVDVEVVKKEIFQKLYDLITLNLDKSIKVVDKITDSRVDGQELVFRVAIIAEENIAISQHK